MKTQTHKMYDPPSKVVAPALQELMVRIARVRAAGGITYELDSAEQEAFERGLEDRKNFLFQIGGLGLAQFGLWRLLKTRITGARMYLWPYRAGSFLILLGFIGNRGQALQRRTLGDFATLPSTSILGNETRRVLAELEGPDGAYFRQICNERQFYPMYNELDTTNGRNPHPQLVALPRLPTMEEMRGSKPSLGDANKSKADELVVVRSGRSPKSAPRDSREADRRTGTMESERKVEDNAPTGDWLEMDDSQQTGTPGRPYDFGLAKDRLVDFDAESLNDPADYLDFDFASKREDRKERELTEALTPSQRRARERREKRRQAREKQQERGASDDRW